MGRVDRKAAIVTGGASGLGLSVCRLLAMEGAKVAVTDILDDEGRAAVDEINEAGGTAKFWHLDVTDEQESVKVFREVYEEFGMLNIAVNNAAIIIPNNVEKVSLKEWNHVININLTGVFLGTKNAVEMMKKSGGGSIVNVSSVAGIIGDPNGASYNASKGGVDLFTKSVALHCAKSGYNIRANTANPGSMWTPMVEKICIESGDFERAKKSFARSHPIGFIADPADMAYGILFLASDESRFVTGTGLVIDGGLTAQ